MPIFESVFGGQKKRYNIPADKVEEFKGKRPDAVEITNKPDPIETIGFGVRRAGEVTRLGAEAEPVDRERAAAATIPQWPEKPGERTRRGIAEYESALKRTNELLKNPNLTPEQRQDILYQFKIAYGTLNPDDNPRITQDARVYLEQEGAGDVASQFKSLGNAFSLDRGWDISGRLKDLGAGLGLTQDPATMIREREKVKNYLGKTAAGQRDVRAEQDYLAYLDRLEKELEEKIRAFEKEKIAGRRPKSDYAEMIQASVGAIPFGSHSEEDKAAIPVSDSYEKDAAILETAKRELKKIRDTKDRFFDAKNKGRFRQMLGEIYRRGDDTISETATLGVRGSLAEKEKNLALKDGEGNIAREASELAMETERMYEHDATISQMIIGGGMVSIPYMTEFAVTRGAAKLLKPATAARITELASKGGLKAAAKIAYHNANLAATMTVLQPSTYARAYEMANEDAVVNGTPAGGGLDFLGKAVAEQYITNASESAGDVFGSLRVKNAGGKVSRWKNVRKQVANITGVHGIPSEFMEEKTEEVSQALTGVGDTTWADVVSPRRNIIMLGTVTFSQLPVQTITAMGYAAGKANNALAIRSIRKGYNRNVSNMVDVFGDESKEAMETVESFVASYGDSKDAVKAFDQAILESDEYTDEEKSAMLNYAMAYAPMVGVDKEARARADGYVAKATGAIEQSVNKDMDAVVTIRTDKNAAVLVGGKIVQKEDGSIDKENSDKTLYYRDENGKIHPIGIEAVDEVVESVSRAEALQQVSDAVSENVVKGTANAQAVERTVGDEIAFMVDGTSVVGMGVIQAMDDVGNYVVAMPDGTVSTIEPRQLVDEDVARMENGNTILYTDADGAKKKGVVADSFNYQGEGLIVLEDGTKVPFASILGVLEDEKQEAMGETVDAPSEGASTDESPSEVEETPASKEEVDAYADFPRKKSGEIDSAKLTDEQALVYAEREHGEEFAIESARAAIVALNKKRGEVSDKMKAEGSVAKRADMQSQIKGIDKRIGVYQEYLENHEKAQDSAPSEEETPDVKKEEVQENIPENDLSLPKENEENSKSSTDEQSSETELDNGRAVEGSPERSVVGGQQEKSGIHRTIEAAYRGGSISPDVSAEEREEPESRGIDKNTNISINEVSKSVSQRHDGTLPERDGGMEEESDPFRRGFEASIRNAQTDKGDISEQEIAEAARAFAKKNGRWVPLANLTELGAPFPSGMENDVYYNDREGSVYKVNNLSLHKNNILSLLERIDLHNQLFPNTAYSLFGFAGFENGAVYPILKQDFVPNANFATPEEIDGYMHSMGFENGEKEAEYSNGKYVVSDLRPRNVLKSLSGNFYVIDAGVELNSSELPEKQEALSQSEDVNSLFSELESEVGRLSELFHTPVQVHYSPDTIQNATAREAAEDGLAKGWYVDGEVHIYLPNATSVEDIQETFFHEVVAHKGVKEMLGDKHSELMDALFDVLPESEQKRLLELYGEKHIAADEYLAELAERGGFESEESRGIISKIVDVIREFLSRYHIRIGSPTAEEIANSLLKESAARLTEKRKEEDAPKFNGDILAYARDINKRNQLREAAKDVDKNPSKAQQEAGNYKKGHVNVHGFDITIENPKGSTRSGVDESGKEWSITMQNDYGYFKRSEGKDGDQIDVFIGNNPESGKIFVVDQVDPETGVFDESKVMLGFNSKEEAKNAYLSNYEKGWQGLGAITETNAEYFKEWLYDGKKQRKAFSEYKDVSAKNKPRKTFREIIDSANEREAKERLSGWFESVMSEQQLPEERTKSSTKGLIEEFVSDDKTHVLSGIYHSNGIVYASDGLILISEEKKYPRKDEGAIKSKGINIKGKYPSVDKVIPKMDVYSEFDTENLVSFVERVETALKSEWNKRDESGKRIDPRTYKVKRSDTYVVLRVNGEDVVVRFDQLDKIAKAANRLGINRIGTDASRIHLAKGNNNLLVMRIDLMEFLKNHPDEEAFAYDLTGDNSGEGGVRFRTRKDSESNSLVAVHNLSEDSLRKAIELGGFPMPSIAITDVNVGHSGFGEISLVFDKSSINPSDRRNKVYTGDAWTPTFPSIGFKINPKTTEKIRNNVESLLSDYNYVDKYMLQLDSYNVDENVNRSGSFMNAYKDNTAMKIAFLKHIGVPFKPALREKKYSQQVDNKTLRKIINEICGGDPIAFINLGYDEKMALEPAMREIVSSYRKQEISKVDLDDRMFKLFEKEVYSELSFSEVDNLLYSSYRYHEEGDKVEIDSVRTAERVKNKFTKKVNEAYEKWLNEISDGIIEKRGIRNNADPFTQSGKRRSWDSLFDEVTLDNVVRSMKSQSERGGQGLFGGNIFGAAQKDMTSISEIRDFAKSHISDISDSEVEAARKEITDRLSSIKIPGVGDNFGGVLDSITNITDAVMQSHDAKGIHRYLKEYYPDITFETAKEIADIVKDIQNMSIRYLEAKPRRAVGLGEVKAAVVPKGIDDSLVGALKSNGANIVEYKKGNESDRQRAISKITKEHELRFRMSDEESRIKERTLSDGTFMKAPNGRPTNLNEQQWLQVRTEAFKKWFGDWEKSARIEKLRKAKPVEITGEEVEPSDDLKQYKKNALEYGKTLRGEYTNKDTGEKIAIGKRGVKEVLQHDYKDREHLQSIAAIPQIIENSIYIDTLPNEDVDKNPDVKAYQYYVSGLKIGGEDYTARAAIAVDSQGNRYYDHKLTDIEKGELLNAMVGITNPVSQKTSPPSGYKDTKLVSLLQTNSSKVVDENGEPLVVYHGTREDGFSIFDDMEGNKLSDAPEGVSFFTDMKSVAYTYSGRYDRPHYELEEDEEGVGSIYEVFLNIRDPRFEDFGGAGWDGQAWGKAALLDEENIEVYPNDGRRFFDSLSEAEDFAQEYDYQNYYVQKDPSVGYTTNEIAEEAMADGNDGAIFYDVVDVGSYGAEQESTVYVTFHPSQIKSATDNTGAFNEKNNDIRFRLSDGPVVDTEDLKKGIRRENRFQRTMDKFQEAYQDTYLPVKRLYERIEAQGVKVEDWENFYAQATHIPGKNQAEIEVYTSKYMNPMIEQVKVLKDKGFSYREIENYVMLKHGKERNEYMRERESAKYLKKHPRATAAKIDELKSKDYAGVRDIAKEVGDLGDIPEIGTAERIAAKFVHDVEVLCGDEAIGSFWDAVTAATRFSLTKSYHSGILSKAGYDELVSRYKYYVPLRGHDAITAEDKWDYISESGSPTFSSPIKRAKGRSTRAESPFAFIFQTAQSSIMAGNKNRLKSTLLNLAESGKAGTLFNISKSWYEKAGTDEHGNDAWQLAVPKYDENPVVYSENIVSFEKRMKEEAKKGNAVQSRRKLDLDGMFIKPHQAAEHEIHIRRNGEDLVLYVNADPALARSVNGANRVISDSRFMHGARWSTRQIAAMSTSLNPLFTASNFMRDLQYSVVKLGAEKGGKFTAGYSVRLGRILFKDRVLIRMLNGQLDLSKKYDQYAYEFLMNGGKTGYVSALNLETTAHRIEKELKRLGVRELSALNPAKEAYLAGQCTRAMGDFFVTANEFAENSIRLAAYITARERGESIVSSVNTAKKVTVNFNRRGSGAMGADAINSLFMFTNVAFQALDNFAKIAKKHKWKLAATMAAYMLSGFLQSWWIDVFGSDDSKEAYWGTSDWDRQNNLCIPIGRGLLRIPHPQELRALRGLGVGIYQSIKGTKAPEDTVLDLLSAVADVVPMGSTFVPAEASVSGVATAVSPTVLQPVTQWVANMNFKGNPIRNAYAPEYAPGHLQARTNRKGQPRADRWIYDLCEFINVSVGRGDGAKKGWIDLNPDAVQHFAGGYFGGLFNTASGTVNTIYMAQDGDAVRELRIRDTPLRRFYAETDDMNNVDSGTMSKYYNISDKADQAHYMFGRYKKQLQDKSLTQEEYREKIEALNYPYWKSVRDQLSAIRRLERRLKDVAEDEQVKLDMKSAEMKRQLVKRYEKDMEVKHEE